MLKLCDYVSFSSSPFLLLLLSAPPFVSQAASAPISETGPLTVETSQPSPSSSSSQTSSALSPASLTSVAASTPLSQTSVSTPPPTMPQATIPQLMPTQTWSMANPEGFVSGGLTGAASLGLGLGMVQATSSPDSNLLPMWMPSTTNGSVVTASSSSGNVATSVASTGRSIA